MVVEVVERVAGGGARVGDVNVTAERRLVDWWVDRVTREWVKRVSHGGVRELVAGRSGHVAIAEAGSVGGVRVGSVRVAGLWRNRAVVGTWYVARSRAEVVAVSERGGGPAGGFSWHSD